MKLDKSEDKNIEKRFVAYSNEVHFYSLSSKQEEAKVLWLGMDYNYHLFALVFSEKIAGKIDVTEDGNFTFLSSNELKNFSSEMVFSRKDYDRLTALGSGLELSVDFGLLGIIAVPILRGLQFLYKYIPNYGVGIILLTLLMRIITFPLQYKSFVSMKRMQKIQPELNKLKEKYKEDPQKMQKETMDLFKKAGANPLGGCLPMLAQMPIFFAFYKVLGASVELVGAPFYFWIHDLSLKDPFFILPILMTGLMFLQQKLTPSGTSDPTQKKIMLLMPLIFGFIMKDLPSGLVLYICVSTVVGIIQQMLVFRAAD
jgi:YidC/Oxa1 family membrane protein insertase